YHSPDRSFSVQHPQGWQVVSDSGAYLITNGEFSGQLDLGNAVPEGIVQIIVISPAVLGELGFSPEDSPSAVIEAISAMLMLEGDSGISLEASTAQERMLAENPSLRLLVELPDGEFMFEAASLAEGTMLIIGQGTLNENLETINTILDSLTLG